MPPAHLAWLLISATLLMLTLPGVALFYGGLVRKKNAVNTLGLAFGAVLLGSVLWVLTEGSAGSSPAASTAIDQHAVRLQRLHQMFASALALALVAGAVVERVRFGFFLAFGLLWLATVVLPVAQWVWGAGWLANIGALDFAGGAVVHLTAGVTGLIVAIMTGHRAGYGRTDMMPSNLPLSICGAGLMWVGWCGFAAGAGHATISAATAAFVAIQCSAAAAALAWTIAEWLQREKPTALGTISGVVAGLVAVAPAAGYVSPLAALVIGIGAGGGCYMAVNFVKPILGYDDALDVFGIHAVGGAWGIIATGLFASTAINPDGSDGLFLGYPYQFFAQLMALLAVVGYSGLMTVVLVWVVRMMMPARVDREAEEMGLDLSQHREKAYS